MARGRRQGKAAKKKPAARTKRPKKAAGAGGRASRKKAAPAKARRPAAAPRRRRGGSRRRSGELAPVGTAERPVLSARLAGGDVDADLARAASSGEEAVGGSVATPDQDVVDEIGEALGVGRGTDAEVITAAEMLEARDRRRWRAERRQADEERP